MGGTRPFEPRDVVQVIALHQKVMLHGAAPSSSLAGYLSSFYGETLFAHPWVDAGLQSLVYEGREGTIIGFLGVVPRPVSFRGRALRMAVCVRFMVDHDAPDAAFAAAGMHTRLVRGPQDLTLMDNDNAASRRIWDATPDAVLAPLASISWTTDPAAPAVRPDEGWTSHTLDAGDLLGCIETSSEGRALQPVYDKESAQWLLDFLDAAAYRGTLHRRMVVDPAGVIRGWYVFYANPAGYNGVLALHADEKAAGAVFRSLLGDARVAGGGSTTTGRLQPELMTTIAAHGCSLDFGPWTVVHARDAELRHALANGDAHLTRLEGEFC